MFKTEKFRENEELWDPRTMATSAIAQSQQQGMHSKTETQASKQKTLSHQEGAYLNVTTPRKQQLRNRRLGYCRYRRGEVCTPASAGRSYHLRCGGHDSEDVKFSLAPRCRLSNNPRPNQCFEEHRGPLPPSTVLPTTQILI